MVLLRTGCGQSTVDNRGPSLIRRQLLAGEPVPPGSAEQVRHWRVGARLRARIAWTWFLIRVRWRTRCARRITCRRSPRVRSSGSQTDGRKSAANSQLGRLARRGSRLDSTVDQIL